jgi:type IV pilus assembly protein PilC
MRQDVKNGMKMAESLEDDPLFPDLLISMLSVGEETAQIGDTIIKIADFYDEEVDIAIGNVQKMIEPIILASYGGCNWFHCSWYIPTNHESCRNSRMKLKYI